MVRPPPCLSLPLAWWLEELVVLVEVFDGVGVVGAWALHELIEVVREALLGCLPV